MYVPAPFISALTFVQSSFPHHPLACESSCAVPTKSASVGDPAGAGVAIAPGVDVSAEASFAFT